MLQRVVLHFAHMNQAPEVTAIDIPDLNMTNLKEPGTMHMKWTATDPNEDELTFEVAIRKEGWNNWVTLAEHLGKAEYDLDSGTLPNGIYYLKVTASDRPDNPEDQAMASSMISSSFIVAHDNPVVVLRIMERAQGRLQLQATATGTLARLASAAYSLNGKSWIALFPTDRLFDSTKKTFRFSIPDPGRSATLIMVRVKDAAGNLGSIDLMVPPLQ